MCEHHFKCIDLIVLQISLKELKISEIELQISMECHWYFYSGITDIFKYLKISLIHLQISVIQLRISVKELQISVIELRISVILLQISI